ncbi:MAG: FAD-binding oxidoreductase [Planctomycetota bacterium]
MSHGPTYETNSWLNDDQIPDCHDQVEGEIQTDWLIIGAGFTGLSAARHLTKRCPHDSITILDADRFGMGSSFRSSGFLVSLGHFDSNLAENKNLYQLGVAGLHDLRSTVQENQIQCDWNEAGRLITARGKAGLRSLKYVQKTLSALGSPFSTIEGSEVESLTSMQGYRGAVRQKESVLVNPAKLGLGLVQSLPPNVRIFENSAVLTLKRQKHWLATTSQGSVKAPKVILANNGFANRLGFGWFRIFPMRTYVTVISSKQPFSKNLIVSEAAAQKDSIDWGVTSVERVGSSIRLVKGKLFVRNNASYGNHPVKKVSQELDPVVQDHLRSAQRRFPNHSLKAENIWSGIIGVSANCGQVFGEIRPNLFASFGYNGHGMVQGTTAGKLLVQLALGESSELLAAMKSLRKPTWIPGGPGRKLGVDLYVKYLNRRFKEEL